MNGIFSVEWHATKPTQHAYVALEHGNLANLDYIVVNWCVGNSCNFACTYCPTNLHDASVPWPSIDRVKQFCARIIETHRDKKVYFEFTGGEVTVWPHFLELCMFLKESGAFVGFISNGSRTRRWWEKAIGQFDHICMSYHSEFAKPEHFKEIVQLVSLHAQVHVNIMMLPDKFDHCFDFAKELSTIPNISIGLQPLIVELKDTLFQYTEDQTYKMNHNSDLISKYIPRTAEHNRLVMRGIMSKVKLDGTRINAPAHTMIADSSNNWYGWECYSGVEQIIVDMSGDVYIGWCKVGGPIGKINDPNFLMPTKPTICTKTMCHCNFDIMSTKRAPNE